MDNRDLDIIEQYLDNALSESDRQDLDQRLQADGALAREFGRRQTAHKALDFMITQNLRMQLRSLEEENKIVSIKSRRRKLTYILYAAASVLLLIGTFTILVPGRHQPAELAAFYYEQPDFSNQRSADSAVKAANKLSEGLKALENGEYLQAVKTLEAIPESDENYIIAKYYQAHAYYLSNQFNKAETAFRLVSAGNEIRYRDQAEWYALLACLNQEGNCGSLLEQIESNTTHMYYQEASKIGRQLK